MAPITGKDRIRILLDGGKPDRIPVMASSLSNAMWLAGTPQREFHTNAETLADTVESFALGAGLDGVYVSSDNWIIHEALGGEVIFPPDDEPWGRATLIQEWSDLSALRVPDPLRAGRMPMMLEAARQVARHSLNRHDASAQTPTGLFVEANIDSGPFQLALTLRGSEQGSLDLINEPERFSELLAFNAEIVIAYGRAMARTGVDAIQFGESSASLIGASAYRDLILPHDQRVIAAIKEEGVKVFLHVCGNSTHLLPDLARTGADCLELDARVDLARAFEVVGSAMAIRGNVDTILLQDGPETTIRESACECLQKAESAKGRLILSPGCGVPKFTPLDHVRALVSSVA